MCGIIGYLGDRKILPVLIDGLKSLQYRGYDSVGVCVLDVNNLFSFKRKGKIQEFEDELVNKNMDGPCGIGHTRWATHGAPNENNSHPHFDCKKEIGVVHNGIIENHSVLRKMLIEEGHCFLSDTDSEVVAHLIEKFYDGDLEEAVVKSLGLIEGAYGLAVMHKDKEEIVVAKKGSPLVVGIGENEMFVSSDVAAILRYTKKVIYLDDGEIGVIKKKNYSIKNLNKEEIEKEICDIKWNVEKLEKGGYKHFMLKEIFEQPESIKNVLRGRIKDNKINLSTDLSTENIRRVIILACGTSWHAALIGKYIIEKLARIPVEVDYASEFRYRSPVINGNDLVIVVSQSGETADTLAALKEAKRLGTKTFGVVNVVNSSISREVDSGIYLHAGPEIGVASTKAFSSQVVALSLFALFLKNKKGEKLDENFLDELNILPSKVNEVFASFEKVKEIAAKYKDSRDFLYLGRGVNFPVALEGALKLKEISYIHAEGYSAAEMKHGPIALIDENMPCVFIANKGINFDKILSNMQEVKARGGKIICVTDELTDNLKELSDDIVLVPKTDELLSPILNNIPLQLLSYFIADSKGIDVDKPRNLAKSVTVE